VDIEGRSHHAPMKSLHIVYSFRPDPIGGTEVYVEGLCRALIAAGDDVVIAAPGGAAGRGTSEAEDVGGLRVRRFAFDPRPADLDVLYGAPDPVAVAAFDRLIAAERPDVVHQHAISPACSVELMACARRHGVPVVFTYHTPAASCQRGTLMRWGTAPCDGRLSSAPCVECVLSSHVSRPVARSLSRVPAGVGRAIGRRGWSGRAWTALRTPSLVERRTLESARLFQSADRYVALTAWVREVLVGNGVPGERIVDVAHGVDVVAPRQRDALPTRSGEVLRIAHLGRFDRTKGTHILVATLRAMPKARISLEIFGIAQTDAAQSYRAELEAMAGGDSRIHFRPPVARGELVETLRRCDVVAVPSQWLETGPLVVLEAFAAGVPVVGSRLGGIADKVADGVNGILVDDYASIPAWREALERLAGDPRVIDQLRQGVTSPRTIADVARQMQAIYLDVKLDQSTLCGRSA
jgi:glycosyltransferase involved in cell wall biosynthesis